VVSEGQLQPGTVLGKRIRLDGIIAVGGMGTVYAAQHLGLQREVAVKLMHPALTSNERLLERFLLEARAAATASQANVVEVLDLDIDDEHGPFMVMERLHGESLTDRIQRAPIDPMEALHITAQVLDVLAAVHAQGIVHRDLKPPNIFLEAGTPPRVKVLDFGLAQVKGAYQPERLTLAGEVVGTPRFMAPEQTFGPNVDHRADLYSTGLLLWCCLTRQPPFAGVPDNEVLRYVRWGPTALHEIRPGLPPELYAWFARALAIDPDHRFQTAAEMRAALEPLLAAGVPQPPPTARVRLPSDPIPTLHFALSVIRLGRRFLLVHERDGSWYLPTAAAHPGEPLVTTALRSVYDEAHLQVQLEGILRIQYTPFDEGTRLRAIFVGRPLNDAPPKSTPDEASLAAGWFALDELDRIPLRGAEVRQLLEYVERGCVVHPLSILSDEREGL